MSDVHYHGGFMPPEEVQSLNETIVRLCEDVDRLRGSNNALVYALDIIRHNWAGHSEACNMVKTSYLGKCDCDWPKVASMCDAALSQAKGTGQ